MWCALKVAPPHDSNPSVPPQLCSSLSLSLRELSMFDHSPVSPATFLAALPHARRVGKETPIKVYSVCRGSSPFNP